MLTWIMENAATILICLILLSAVTAIVVRMAQNKRKGRSSCGCEGCAMSGNCHSK